MKEVKIRVLSGSCSICVGLLESYSCKLTQLKENLKEREDKGMKKRQTHRRMNRKTGIGWAMYSDEEA